MANMLEASPPPDPSPDPYEDCGQGGPCQELRSTEDTPTSYLNRILPRTGNFLLRRVASSGPVRAPVPSRRAVNMSGFLTIPVPQHPYTRRTLAGIWPNRSTTPRWRIGVPSSRSKEPSVIFSDRFRLRSSVAVWLGVSVPLLGWQLTSWLIDWKTTPIRFSSTFSLVFTH